MLQFDPIVFVSGENDRQSSTLQLLQHKGAPKFAKQIGSSGLQRGAARNLEKEVSAEPGAVASVHATPTHNWNCIALPSRWLARCLHRR